MWKRETSFSLILDVYAKEQDDRWIIDLTKLEELLKSISNKSSTNLVKIKAFYLSQKFKAILNHSAVYQLMVKYFPKIQSVDIRGLYWPYVNAWTNCENIREFKLSVHVPKQKDLLMLFSRNINFRCLSLELRNVDETLLLNLPVDMEEICLINCFFMPNVFETLPRFQKLRSFKIRIMYSNYTNSPLEKFNKVLIENNRNLVFTDKICIKSVTQLENLEELHLESLLQINDEFLIELSSKCKKLSKFYLNGYSKITDVGLAALTELPRLSDLKVNLAWESTGKPFAEMKHLKFLICQYYTSLENESLIGLLKSSLDIEILDIKGCDNITNEFLEFANNLTKLRNNTLTLTIIVNKFNAINVNKIQIDSPLLKVVIVK